MDHLSGQSTPVSTQIWKNSSVFDKVLSLFLILSTCICLVCYPWEFLGRPTARAKTYTLSRPSSRNLKLSLWLPHAAWLVCGALGIIQLFLEPSKPESCGKLEQTNPDTVGMGVRIGLMLIMGLTIFSILAGASGYRGETGAKELGITSLASMYHRRATDCCVHSLRFSQAWQSWPATWPSRSEMMTVLASLKPWSSACALTACVQRSP
jgi:hypothetical protein